MVYFVVKLLNIYLLPFPYIGITHKNNKLWLNDDEGKGLMWVGNILCIGLAIL